MNQDRLQQLEEWASSVRSGAMSREDFAAALRTTSEAVAEQEARIRGVELPAEAVEGLREELAAGFAGLTMLRQAVDRMSGFATDGDEAHLDEGLAIARQANEELLRAVQLNRQSREALESLYRDLSSQQG